MSTGYQVELQKGEVVTPRPHPDSCTSVEALIDYTHDLDGPLAADLFCGAGGLSLGLKQAGIRPIIGVDYDDYALETYRSLFPGLAWKLDLNDESVIDQLVAVAVQVGVEVLVGGPPCQPFSRAGRSTIRKLVEKGIRSPDDHRRDLWQSFLEVVARVGPRAVLIENVPDMALGDESLILRLIVADLESQGYAVACRLIDAWRHGVPQHRQRLIIVALANRTRFHWPEEIERYTTVDDAISDLPVIEGGWDEAGAEGWLPYSGPLTSFQQQMRESVAKPEAGRIYDHVTRSVRDDDREIFASMDSTTKYSELDPSLKRYRDDIFDDKYKRLAGSDVSRTIIAHLAKDGYGFIHPDQDRTISIREAARLQTFPDRVRFAGPPTAALRQIGNAVPPILGHRLGEAILQSLSAPVKETVSTAEVATGLSDWFHVEGTPGTPWLSGESPWAVRVGEALLRAGDPMYLIGPVWGAIHKLEEPSDVDERAEELRSLVTRPSNGEDLEKVISDAKVAINGDRVKEDSAWRLAGLAASRGDRSLLFTGRGVLRVVARFTGTNVDQQNQGSDGRLLASRMVGIEPEATSANMALVGIAQSICTPVRPKCGICPLRPSCSYAAVSDVQLAFDLDH